MPKQRTLPHLLKALQPTERAEFHEFLRSPFFNKNKSFAIFFKRLCQHYPQNFDGDDCDWETVFIKTFPGRNFNVHKLDILLPSLSRLLEYFFAVKEAFPGGTQEKSHKPPIATNRKKQRCENLPASPAALKGLRRNLQSHALGKRNIFQTFEAETTRLIADLEAKPFKDADDYLTLHQLYHRLYFHPDTSKFGISAADLESAMENLDLHFFLNKLRYIAEMKTRERIFDVHHHIPLMNEVLEKTADPALMESHPLIAIYHRLVRLYCKGVDEPGFQELIALFLKKFHLLPQAEQLIFLQHLINYGIFLGEQHCQIEAALLALYKKGIDAGILLTGDRLTDGAFTNIVFTAALCGEFEWAEAFMSEFSPRIEDGRRSNAVALAKSCLHYAQGRLDEAQTHLLEVDITEPSYDTRAKGLLMKIAFDRYVREGKDYLFLISHLAAFEKYVQSRQLWEEKKLAFLNCIRFTRKMANLKFGKVDVPEERKQTLRLNLEKMSTVISKNWLAQKIGEL